jgi:hypothetical protein
MKVHCSAIVASAFAVFAAASASAQGITLPWGQSSDMIAWQTFVQVMSPSGDPNSKNVEFETWASDQDIYAKSPPQWPPINAPKQLQVSMLRNARPSHGIRPFVIAPEQCTQNYDHDAAIAAGFPANGCIGEEVRRNWASFQYIVSNNLYSKPGLMAAFKANLKIDLPGDAIEIKGDWVKVADIMSWLKLSEQQVHDLYHVNRAADTTGATSEFALVAFHFSTKQIKNWVWADFEHQMNPGRCDDSGCNDSFGAETPVVVKKVAPNQYYGECKKSAPLQAMFTNGGLDSVWQNYCLKGSQVSFVTSNGQATILGNSVIERINAGVPIMQSSCITCHGYASFNKDGNINGAVNDNLTGVVDQSKLQGFLSNDFIWGITSIK